MGWKTTTVVVIAVAIICLLIGQYLYSNPIIPQPPTQHLFSDGFESGSFSAWATSITNGQVLVLTGGQRTGNYVGSFSISAVTGMCGATAYKNMTGASTFWARGYFKFGSIPFALEGDRVYVLMFATGSPNYADVAYAGIVRTWDGQNRWELLTRNGTAYVAVMDTSRTVNVGQYYCVELGWNGVSGTSGSATMYVDGFAILTVTGIDTAYYGTARLIYFGIAQKMGTTAFAIQVTADDCVIDDSRIGM